MGGRSRSGWLKTLPQTPAVPDVVSRRRIEGIRPRFHTLVNLLEESFQNPLGEHAAYVSNQGWFGKLFFRVPELIPGKFFQENPEGGFIRALISSTRGQIVLTCMVNQMPVNVTMTPQRISVSVYGPYPEVLGGLVREYFTSGFRSSEIQGFILTMQP